MDFQIVESTNVSSLARSLEKLYNAMQ